MSGESKPRGRTETHEPEGHSRWFGRLGRGSLPQRQGAKPQDRYPETEIFKSPYSAPESNSGDSGSSKKPNPPAWTR
jgi:hypothetical protein